MKNIGITLAFMAVVVFTTAAQVPSTSLFMPPDIQKTYQKGTRSWDGHPGEKLWVNEARYTIEVQVDPRERKLSGSEQVVYFNNSPDTLNTLWVRLLQNIYATGSARDFSLAGSPDMLNEEGVQLKEVSIDGTAFDPADRNKIRRTSTNLGFTLPSPLFPGDSLVFTAQWEYRISGNLIREGYRDSTTAFIGYWYPQISVYDDIWGWDQSDYLGGTEFYEGLGDFDVHISLPEGYVVWATGELQNPREVLSGDLYGRWEQSWQTDSVVAVIGAADVENGLSTGAQPWHFRAQRVPDFAFAFSDHYYWDASSLAVGSKRVSIHSVYPPENAQNNGEVLTWIAGAIRYFSDSLPGLEYPYPAFTSFNGKTNNSGGMEWPMLANNAIFYGSGNYAYVVIHEFGHTYAPFLLRINEIRYAWLDEGWTDYISRRTLDHLGIKGSVIGTFLNQMLAQHFRRSQALPLMAPSSAFEGDEHSPAFYGKPTMIFKILQQTLGDERFDRCVRTFFREWQYKSPTPYDLFFTFNRVAGEDLSWFWEPWFFKFGYPDLAAGMDDEGKLTVTNRGGLPVPVDLVCKFENGSEQRMHFDASVWKDGQPQFRPQLPVGKVTRAEVDAAFILDVFPEDNIWERQ